MNCQAVRNKILALPDPRHVPESLREHVAGCAGCRAWAKQAARLEAILERLPVPPAPANRKAKVLDDLTREAPIISRPPTVPARDGSGRRAWEFVRRNATAVGGLAAAVLVAAGGWWLFTGGPDPNPVVAQSPKHPFLEKVVKRDVALAKAKTPAERLELLGGLAGDLSTEARELARVASPDDLREIARWFDKVVQDGMVRQAGKVPEHAMTPDAKRKLLGALAAKLGDTAAEAEKLIGEVPPEAQPHLRRIAETARDGQKKLQG